ncbi:MAG: ATP-dependent metallopeptidase FtsH/Yme1/Tma family protein, partial [Thermomicrobiales bacterium]
MMDPSGRNPQTPKKPAGGKPPAQPQSRFRLPGWLLWSLLAVLAGWYVYMFLWPEDDPRIEINYSALVGAVEAGQVTQVEITGQKVEGEFTEELRWTGTELLTPDEDVPADADSGEIETGAEFTTTIPENVQEQFVPLLEDAGVRIEASEERQSILPTLLISVLPLMLFLGLIIFMGRNMSRGQQNVFGFGRSRAKMYDPERPHITFADVAGEEEAKQELTEVGDFLKNPMNYHQIGARLPRGILLVGPP